MLEGLSLLIIDDDKVFLRDTLENLTESGYKIFTAPTVEDGLPILTEEKILVTLLGLNQNQDDIFHHLKQFKTDFPFLKVIIMAQKGNFKVACRAMTLGAYDFLVKSPNMGELIPIIDRAHRQARRSAKKKAFLSFRRRSSESPSLPEFIGQSTAIKSVFHLVNKVAPTNTFVLIGGETGVGKELVAHQIHHDSSRSRDPFITVNCGAVPENLLENEFFGHAKGAFTDSVSVKRGLFEEANGGTLFLDEVAELNPTLQVKLLRVIETGTFRRLGDNQERRVDFRIISATNRNMADEIKSGRLRSDFYYRLAVLTINIQPLRFRKDDISLLIEHFLKSYKKTYKGSLKKFSSSAMQMILEHDWPGNVRELKNFIERVSILSENEMITPADVALAIPALDDYQVFWEEFETSDLAPIDSKSLVSLEKMEKRYIQYALKAVGGDLHQASELLRISLQVLRDKIHHYSLPTNKIADSNF